MKATTAVSTITVFVLLCFMTCLPRAHALANSNPLGDFISKLNLGPIAIASPAPATALVDRTDEVLKELGVTSSTEPKPFFARQDQLPTLLTASFVTGFRLGSGVFANGYQLTITEKDDSKYTVAPLFDKYQVSELSTISGKFVPTAPLILYEFETCPFCRKVREAVSILSLTVTYLPCPKDGTRYRSGIKAEYGKRATFPFLIDPNTGIKLFESDDIINYLFQTYGNGEIPWTLSPGSPLVPLSAGLGLVFRGGSGGQAKSSNPPSDPVKVWLYEGSPFCKVVKETLCELEIPHTQVSCPRGSPNRQRLLEQVGRFQVPYLEDPNTGVSLFESEAIVEYLQKQYGVVPSTVEYL